MQTARVILAALGFVAGISTARAADLAADVVVVRPAVVVAPFEVWQGHFTGGRNLLPGAQPTALDWVDTTARFPSLRACGRWMAALGREYARYEGWKGCLRIR